MLIHYQTVEDVACKMFFSSQEIMGQGMGFGGDGFLFVVADAWVELVQPKRSKTI